jgi:uncharacterized membrane protein
MIRFENRVLIRRSLEDVFHFIADFRNIPKWNYYVRSVDLENATHQGIGTTYHQIRREDEQRFEITEYDSPNLVGIRTLAGSMPSFEMSFRLEEVADGTLVYDRWQLNTGKPRIIEKLFRKRIRTAVAQNLAKLKELLETDSVTLQDGRVQRL